MSEEWSPVNPLFDNVWPGMMCALRIAGELSHGIFADVLRLNSLSPDNAKLLKFDPIRKAAAALGWMVKVATTMLPGYRYFAAVKTFTRHRGSFNCTEIGRAHV